MMECRGLDIIDVKLGNSMTVTVADSGTDYENADFTYIGNNLGIFGLSMTKRHPMLLKWKSQKS